jgi:hypothetical protein
MYAAMIRNMPLALVPATKWFNSDRSFDQVTTSTGRLASNTNQAFANLRASRCTSTALAYPPN